MSNFRKIVDCKSGINIRCSGLFSPILLNEGNCICDLLLADNGSKRLCHDSFCRHFFRCPFFDPFGCISRYFRNSRKLIPDRLALGNLYFFMCQYSIRIRIRIESHCDHCSLFSGCLCCEFLYGILLYRAIIGFRINRSSLLFDF